MCATSATKRCAASIGVVPQKAMLLHGHHPRAIFAGATRTRRKQTCTTRFETAQALDVVYAKSKGLDEPVEQGGTQLLRRPASAPDHRPRACPQAGNSDSGRQRLRAGLRDGRAACAAPSAQMRTSADDFHRLPARGLRPLCGSDHRAGRRRAWSGMGTHDELLASCPVYQEIYASQFKKEGKQMVQEKKRPPSPRRALSCAACCQYIGPHVCAGRCSAGAVSHQRRADAVSCRFSSASAVDCIVGAGAGGFRRPHPDSDDHRRLHRHHGGGAVGYERAATTASPTTPCATSAAMRSRTFRTCPSPTSMRIRRATSVSRMIADVDTFADGLLMGFTQLFTGVMTILGHARLHADAERAASRWSSC